MVSSSTATRCVWKTFCTAACPESRVSATPPASNWETAALTTAITVHVSCHFFTAFNAYAMQSRVAGGMFLTGPVVRYQACEQDVLETNEPILMQ